MLAVLLLAATYTLHAKDVFQPPKPAAIETWSAPAPRRESLEFHSTTGAPIRGWIYRTTRANAPTVLFFYGSNEDLRYEANRLAWLCDTLHVNAAAFDYPGYGYSGGTISISAIRSAAVEEYDYLNRIVLAPGAPIISYGWSIGTALALQVAAERPAAGLILQAAPADAATMLRASQSHDVPRLLRWAVQIEADPEVAKLYDGATVIRQVTAPLLLLHGTEDEVVPLSQSQALLAVSASPSKQLVEIPHAHHNDLHISQEPAAGALTSFVLEVDKRTGLSAPQPEGNTSAQ